MDDSGSSPALRPAGAIDLVDRLQGSGRYSFREEDVVESLGGSSVARQAALRRLKKKGRIVSPRRGFFVIVPLEYRAAGSPPASWFIEDLMAYLRRPYYVGLLTAAAVHGAGHQRAQVFQVVTDVPTRPIKVARLRVEFHRNRNIQDVPVTRIKTETGSMRVSTPEATALDLVRYPEACGYLDNVATVLVELAERIDPGRLAKVAANGRHPDAQRLGYLLERVGLERTAKPLATLVASRRRRPVLLRPDRPGRRLTQDPRWQVVVNEDVAPDL